MPRLDLTKELRDALKAIEKQPMDEIQLAAYMDVEPARAHLYLSELGRKGLIARREDKRCEMA